MPDAQSSNRRQLDARAVSRALDRQARQAAAPWLHGEVARRMAERLQVIRLQPQLLIDWWAGPGASREVLTQAYPKARRIAAEASAAWLGAPAGQSGRGAWWSPRRWWGDAQEAWLIDGGEPVPQAQLIWANMMLHAAVDPVALIERWHGLLEPGGFLMFSCLGPDTLRELRQVYRAQGWPAPGVDFVDMHDLGDMLVRAGFSDPVMDQERITLTWASPEALLAELRQLGGNAHPGRFAGLRTPRWRRQLEQALADLKAPDGRYRLTFEVSYGHAFKGLPRLKVDKEVRVSEGDLRAMIKGSAGDRRGR